MIYQVVKRFIDSSHAHFCFVLVIKLSLQVSFDSVVHVVLTFFFFALNISFLLIVNVFLFFLFLKKWHKHAILELTIVESLEALLIF